MENIAKERKYLFYEQYCDRIFRTIVKRKTGKNLLPKKIDGKKIMDIEAGNSYILELINKQKPFMVARFGSTEIQLVNKYIAKKSKFI